MTEREYAADLKRAVAQSPQDSTDAWEYYSHEITFELVPYNDKEDGPIRIFPQEWAHYEGTIVVGWMQHEPGEDTPQPQEKRSGKSVALLSAAQGLTDILSVMKKREQEGLTVPTVILGMNLNQEEAKFAYKRLGFYYLGNNPGTYPFEDTFDMGAATKTLRHNLEALKNKPIRGKTLFARLQERRK